MLYAGSVAIGKEEFPNFRPSSIFASKRASRVVEVVRSKSCHALSKERKIRMCGGGGCSKSARRGSEPAEGCRCGRRELSGREGDRMVRRAGG